MMKIHFLFCALSTAFIVSAQNLSSVDEQFDNFEFSKALVGYENLKRTALFDTEHDEKLAYCYYILAETKGIKHLDSLVKTNENKDYLWLWKGTLEKDDRAYEEAIKSFEKFKLLNKELNVDNLILSCREIPTWLNVPRASVFLSETNDRYANSFSALSTNDFLFIEMGIDADAKNIGIASKSEVFAEILLSKPFLLDGESLSEVTIDGMEHFSIHRVCSMAQSNEVVFDAIDYFSERPISKLYSGIYNAGKISDVKLLSISNNDTLSLAHPTISEDGKTLVFSAISNENSDLYTATYENGEWVNMINLSNINTEGNESYPVFTGDSLLSFASDGRIGYGGLDVYYIAAKQLKSAEAVKHFKAPINSSTDDFNLYWKNSVNATFVSNRSSGKGDDDVWKLTIEPEKIPEIVDDGFKEWFEKWKSSKVYFDFDLSVTDIKQELLEGIKKYAGKYNLVIDLVGHTDAQGSPEYNLQLGLNRATFVAEKITERSVSKEVVSVRSVGEKELVNACRNGMKCTDQQHLENRFVSIEITKH